MYMILRIRRYILLLCIIHSCILIYLYSVSNTKKSHDLPLPFQGQPIREDIKYYFADCVRKWGGEGVPPVTFFSPKELFIKGGGYSPYGQNLQSSI